MLNTIGTATDAIDLTPSEAKVLLLLIHMLDIRGSLVMARGYDDDWELWTELEADDVDNIPDYEDLQLWLPESIFRT